MINRTTTVAEAVAAHVRAGQTVMVGGFGRPGVPFSVLAHLAEHAERYGDLTLVKNDASEPGLGVDLLLSRGMVRRLIATHIGLNPDVIAQLNRGEIATELVPQGIFAERIRAGGAGIPAFLTDIGLDTEVAEGKPTVDLDGRELLLERALRGDVALIGASVADRAGNVWWRGSTRNMGMVMATACDRVIVEAEEIVPIGALEPENVHLPAVFVDAVVPAGPRPHLATPEDRS
jgi:acetate CoA/acetoacetate CoA-transferase alpha subunit